MTTDKRGFLFSVIILLAILIHDHSFAESSGDIARDLIKDIMTNVNCIKKDQAWKYIKNGGDSGCDFIEKKEPCSIIDRIWWWKKTTFDVEEQLKNSPFPVCFKQNEKDLTNNIIANKFISLNRDIIRRAGKKFFLESYINKYEKEEVGCTRASSIRIAHRNEQIFKCYDLLQTETAIDHARKVYYNDVTECLNRSNKVIECKEQK